MQHRPGGAGPADQYSSAPTSRSWGGAGRRGREVEAVTMRDRHESQW